MTASGARVLQTIVWLASFAAAFSLAGIGIVHGLDAAAVDVRFVDMDSMEYVQEQLPKLEHAAAENPDEVQVALLGDSTSMYFGDRPRGIERRLEPELAAAAPNGPRHRVTSFAVPAFTIFVQYFIAERVADAGAERVVLVFNLHELGNRSLQVERPQLSGWLPPHALADALRLPLHVIGLSTDELLLYASAVQLGGFEPWRRLTREQARLAKSWQQLEEWLQNALCGEGLAYKLRLAAVRREALFQTGPPQRETPHMVRLRLGPALGGVDADHPALRVLGALLDVFRAHGVPVLVYTPPLNVEYHERLGVYDRSALQPALEALRRTVEAHGARLLDLHAELPDRAFEDGSSHLTAGDPIDAQSLVAQRLARALLELPAAP
jgi:hypothetical protein